MVGKKVLRDFVNHYKDFDPMIYHNAHELLRIYSDIVWSNVESYTDVNLECEELYDLKSCNGLEILIEIGEKEKALQLKERLRNIAENQVMIDAVRSALLHVKAYKRNGEIYYTILCKSFLENYQYSEVELLTAFKMSRSTFYRRRKEAIHLFGVSLWGFIIPNVISSLEEKYCETDLRLI